jgi:hypothetical protein
MLRKALSVLLVVVFFVTLFNDPQGMFDAGEKVLRGAVEIGSAILTEVRNGSQ